MVNSSQKQRDLSAQDDSNPINPEKSRIPIVNNGEGLPGLKSSFEDPAPGPSKYAEIQSPGVNRPPKPPGDYLGPYFQFITTRDHVWYGSALLFRPIGLPKPELQLECSDKAKVKEPEWELLYEDIFKQTAWRVNLAFDVLPGEGDSHISWKIEWKHPGSESKFESGKFAIAHEDAKWRGGFFSCNGFDATVPVDLAQSLTYNNVWNHLGSVHLENPLHLLIWGGDQNYIDFIFDDIPFLKRWVEMEWNKKWQHEFSAKTEREVSEYHFNTYCENWERKEVKLALANIPALMSWDDHDIFDGAGSYPPLLHESPVMSGLFLCAQRFRLLFQHHTTPDLARKHQLFGDKGFNFVSQCGPNMAVLLTDGRTERSPETIQTVETWNQIFKHMDTQIAPTTNHLLAVFAVPLSFVRIRIAESIFEILKKAPNKVRQLPIIKGTNSIFGLPELYDDLLDEWTHDAHIAERNSAIKRFQEFAKRKQCRVTFMSGDVHCCGLSRFRTPPAESGRTPLTPLQDSKMMYQVISSAIVNMPPPRNALRAYHYFPMKWQWPSTPSNPNPKKSNGNEYMNPGLGVEEEFMNFFERMPEGGRKLRHKKLLPNRNWCYFELVGSQEIETAEEKNTLKVPLPSGGHGKNAHNNLLNSSHGVDHSDLSTQDHGVNGNATSTATSNGISVSQGADESHTTQNTFAHGDIAPAILRAGDSVAIAEDPNNRKTSDVAYNHKQKSRDGATTPDGPVSSHTIFPEAQQPISDPLSSRKGPVVPAASDFWRLHYPFTKSHPYPSSLGPTSTAQGLGGKNPLIHQHKGGMFCRHKKHHEIASGASIGDLRIRLWLESSKKEPGLGRKFASYEVVIPPVEQ